MKAKHLLLIVAAVILGSAPIVFAGKSGGGSGGSGGGGGGGGSTTQTYDTSFAVEYSYSCLSGGCHETNTQLLDDYKASYMTHVMVKCNACHGTHTAAEVGLPKPNLTGYVAGKGATGYVVGKDRCLTCHTASLTRKGHPNNPGECISCHGPHVFRPMQ